MTVQTVVTDVKGRIEKLAVQGQEVATISFDTLKSANGIVVETVQTLVKTNGDSAVALFDEAKLSFGKATKDGIQAVIANPIAYLPSTSPAVSAFNDSVKTLIETRGELVKTFEGGYSNIKATITGTPAVVASAKKVVKAAVKKTEVAAKKTVKTVAKKVKA